MGAEESGRAGGFAPLELQQQTVPRQRAPQQQERVRPLASSPFNPEAVTVPPIPAQPNATTARIVMIRRSRRGLVGCDGMGMEV